MEAHEEIDEEHVTHNTEDVEDVRDNAVEHTVWAKCWDCDVTFRRINVTITGF